MAVSGWSKGQHIEERPLTAGLADPKGLLQQKGFHNTNIANYTLIPTSTILACQGPNSLGLTFMQICGDF